MSELAKPVIEISTILPPNIPMPSISPSVAAATNGLNIKSPSLSTIKSSYHQTSHQQQQSAENNNNKQSNNSWLLRFFESKHFDMSIAISYLFNTKEPGVQTYLCNRLFTFSNKDVDFYLPQLLTIYIYCCNDNNEQLIADLLNSYFRSRCSCRKTGIDFSIRCSWLLDAHINDNAKLATRTKESRIRRGLNNAIKLYKLIISERLRPINPHPNGSNSSSTNNKHDNRQANFNNVNGYSNEASKSNGSGNTGDSNASHNCNSSCVSNSSNILIITSPVREEPINEMAAASDSTSKPSFYQDVSSDEANSNTET